MRPFAFLLPFVLGCSLAAPPKADICPPVPLAIPPPRTMTIAVPADCPHMMIVDIVLTDESGVASESDVTVACFTRFSSRTFLVNTKGPPFGIENEPDSPARLVLEFVSSEKISSVSAGQ